MKREKKNNTGIEITQTFTLKAKSKKIVTQFKLRYKTNPRRRFKFDNLVWQEKKRQEKDQQTWVCFRVYSQ